MTVDPSVEPGLRDVALALDGFLENELQAEGSHRLDLDCWCGPYRDPTNREVIIHRKAAQA